MSKPDSGLRDYAKTPLLSVVTPCHNEEKNLPLLRQRLSTALQDTGMDWELIIVDDHSTDDSFGVVRTLSENDRRVKAIRLARNVGSHLAIVCGIEYASGSAIAVLAADLQDPPELLPQMLDQWRKGNQIVWAVREKRIGISGFERLTSRIFHRISGRIIRTVEVDPGGVDFFVIDRVVGEALKAHREGNISIFALLHWMGFRQGKVSYTKEARARGQSSWNFTMKLKLLVDTIAAFSFFPIRAMSSVGIIAAGIGFLYALFVFVNAFGGKAPSGWSSVIVVLLILGGMQIVMLGVIGEYLWRSLAETRQRPRYLIEDQVGFKDAGPHIYVARPPSA